MIASIVGGIVVLLLAGLVYWRKKTKAKRKVEAVETAAQLEGEAAAAKDQPLTRDEIEKQIQERLEQHSAEAARKEAEALMSLQMPEVEAQKSDVLQKHISAEAKRDPSAMAQVLRTWLDADKRR
jgi:flagellar biosynthesis/type III secretory pathway M-ring protein FliF/YscJ